jgi:uncharacterized membrane protein
MSDRFATNLFRLAALWNFVAALFGLFASKLAFELLFGEDAYVGDYHQLWLFRVFWMAVLLFGVGYLLVSLDVTENRGMVWLGILGKIAVFAFVLHAFASDEATVLWLLIAVGDFLWTLLFAWFLAATRGKVRVSNLLG